MGEMAGTESRRVSCVYRSVRNFLPAIGMTSGLLAWKADPVNQHVFVFETLPHDTSFKRARPVAEHGNVIKVIGGFLYRRGEARAESICLAGKFWGNLYDTDALQRNDRRRDSQEDRI